jgi:hypothetical protein
VETTIKGHLMTEIHNMHFEQAMDWLKVARQKDLTNNEIRIWILMKLLHDGWIGINGAFDICEEFGIFTSRLAVQHDFAMFHHPEYFDEDGNVLKKI